MKLQKRLSGLLVGTMILASMSQAVLASDYENHWAKEAIQKWSDKKVVEGYEDGTFKPKQDITRAELAKIIVEIFGLNHTSDAKSYSDVSASDWYAPYIAAVSSAGIMNDWDKLFNPNQVATREEAAYAIANAYKVSKGTADFEDVNQISDWATEKVGALASNGYIKGRPDGTFGPTDTLTRADVITMIDKITADLITTAGTYNQDVQGNLVVNAGHVVLKDMVVNGNLYIAEGVGEGDITLDHVEVTGTVFLEGSGENSCKVLNESKLGNVQINKANNKAVRLYGDKTSEIKKIDVDSKCIIEGPASFKVLNVVSEVEVEIRTAEIQELNVAVKATIILNSSAVLKNLSLDALTVLTGNGKIDQCKVNISGCKLSIVPNKTTFTNDKDKMTIGSKEYDKDTINKAAESSPSTSSGSSGGSGSSGNSGNNTPSTPSNPSTPSTPSTPDGAVTPNPGPVIEPGKEPVVIVPEIEKEKKIVDISYQTSIAVSNDTTIEQMAQLLPTEIVVIYNDGSSSKLSCTWGEIETSTDLVDVYEVIGKVNLPQGVTDPDKKLESIKVLITLQQQDQLMAPSKINILEDIDYIESEQSNLSVEVEFPQAVTTPGVLHIQIGDLQEQTVLVNEGDTSIEIDLDVSELAFGSHDIRAWFVSDEEESETITTSITKLEAVKEPDVVDGIEGLESAMEQATEELLIGLTVDATNITRAQLEAYDVNNNQTLVERIKGCRFYGTVDELGNMCTIMVEIDYKTMYEASKFYCEPEKEYVISDTASEVLDVAEYVINETITEDMDKYEKEKAIHDYIVANTAYGTPVEDSYASVYAVEGVLLDEVAVCQGYAEAMKLFMDMLDIECDVVLGTGISEEGEISHAWNLIQLDDNEWYHLDATWNDPTPDVPGHIIYNYFNLTDEMILKDHKIKDGMEYEPANGTEYFYYADIKVTTKEELGDRIDALLKADVLSGELYYTETIDANAFMIILREKMDANLIYGDYSCTGRSKEIDTGSNGYNGCDNGSVYGALFCNRS